MVKLDAKNSIYLFPVSSLMSCIVVNKVVNTEQDKILNKVV